MSDTENISVEHYDEDGNLIGTETFTRPIDPATLRAIRLEASRVTVEGATTLLGLRQALLAILDALDDAP